MVRELELLKEWQERLGLLDWAIKLKINCKQDEMDLGEVAGETEWSLSIKSASIKIISKEEYGERIVPYDFENILIHELLHLKFGLIDQKITSYESDVAYEVRHQLIDDLARALVMAKRGETKRKLTCDIITDMKIEELVGGANDRQTKVIL